MMKIGTTPFSDLWWWQKRYFKFCFGNNIAIELLKRTRARIAEKRGHYVCNAIWDETSSLGVKPVVKWGCADALTRHIRHVQKVVTYEDWLSERCGNIRSFLPSTSIREERLRWLDQMIDYLESK